MSIIAKIKPRPASRREPQPAHNRRKLPQFRPVKAAEPERLNRSSGPWFTKIPKPPKLFGRRIPLTVLEPIEKMLTVRGLARLALRANPYFQAGIMFVDLWDTTDFTTSPWVHTTSLKWVREPYGYTRQQNVPYTPEATPTNFTNHWSLPNSYDDPWDKVINQSPWPNIIGSCDCARPYAYDVANGGYWHLVNGTWIAGPPRALHEGTWVKNPVSQGGYHVPTLYQPHPLSGWNPSPMFPNVPYDLLTEMQPMEYYRERWFGEPDALNEPRDEPKIQYTIDHGRETLPGPHIRQKPDGRTKEKKLVPNGFAAMRTLQNVFHTLTEIGDFVDCIFKTLPRNVKWVPGRPISVADKLKLIYEHFDEIQWDQAVKNLVLNEIEDRVIGKGFAYLQKAGKGLGVKGSYKLYQPGINALDLLE